MNYGPVCFHALQTLRTCYGPVCFTDNGTHSFLHSYMPDDIVGRAL